MAEWIHPHMRESLKDHVLETVVETEKVQAYYLKKPGDGRMMSTLILFTPEGIVLQGDLTLGRNGNVSTLGHGRRWFSGDLSGSYLCEKFLHRVFVPAYAIEGLRYEILQQRRQGDITKERARELWRDCPTISDDFRGPQETYDFWTDDLRNRDGDGCPGYGYEPGEAGRLCVIQQKFAELYSGSKAEEIQAVAHG